MSLTPAEARRFLRADKAWCLHKLRGYPVEDYAAVLKAEQSRTRPRKRLIQALQQHISTLQSR